MKKEYTREEVRRILVEAGKPSTTDDLRYSLEEVRAAAEEAGISSEHLERATERLERRRGVRIGLVISLVGCIIATFILTVHPPETLGGWSRGSLVLHNEHRSLAYDVEVLVPEGALDDCGPAPPLRFTGDEYQSWQTVRLLPGDDLRLSPPRSPETCPQVWIRTFIGGLETGSATFELPVSVEIERSGRLDQRGAGHPLMHPPPMLRAPQKTRGNRGKS